MEKSNKIVSHHTFMFPFIYDCKNEELMNEDWEYKKYHDNYNEIAYFHSFFKESMLVKDKNANSSFYKHKKYKNSMFIISHSKEYKLNLKSVNLRLFSTGVGILSFHIENKVYEDISDILEINDYGRRIYPEYLNNKLKCKAVPNFIQLHDIKEDFTHTERVKEILLSKLITEFLPKKKIRAAVDDRMFVISFYKNTQFSIDVKSDYVNNDKWYEYVFVDGDGKTVQNKDMQTELIKNATYPRWQGYGTMYGMSKYSFACLAKDDCFAEENVEVHMQTMYFQMFSLLLMVRATILKFSSEVSAIAKDIDNSSSANSVNDLYKRYIQFVNSFYFREITAKNQGLEIYEKALTILNIERDIKDLDAEIEELHTYVEMQSEKENAGNMNLLTWIGGIMLPPSIITSFLGMNFLDGIGEYIPKLFLDNKGITSTFLVVLSALVIPCYLKCKSLNK